MTVVVLISFIFLLLGCTQSLRTRKHSTAKKLNSNFLNTPVSLKGVFGLYIYNGIYGLTSLSLEDFPDGWILESVPGSADKICIRNLYYGLYLGGDDRRVVMMGWCRGWEWWTIAPVPGETNKYYFKNIAFGKWLSSNPRGWPEINPYSGPWEVWTVEPVVPICNPVASPNLADMYTRLEIKCTY